ncbi:MULTISPECIES: DUF4139 domain-containing protein [unclassified Achromobacter]|uniref:DUF4139 domain-containing protein n=1 Tax=unclassified Achromobacter TaxID=2626865 RepID=UPI000B5186F2|nr:MULTISPECIES: DUF4139 domain-containing protein [unclassified Achromobacter]OWT73534.1 hypothetical protein CEY05_20695 [Achromobacter sp. HZ34]OWT79548.1 hypothetical protein CEY04_11285 [Achromobacter sp. HZ28]
MPSAALSPLAIALFLVPAAPLLAQTAVAPIDRITLSSGGVAQVHRQVQVDGDGVVRISVPAAQIDDVLKSLLVRDPKGALESVTLDGPAPVDEAFAQLPFDAGLLGALPDLLKQMPGTRVRATSGGRTIEGAVLGTQTVDGKQGDTTLPQSTLSVLTAERRIDTLRLGADTSVEVLDDGMRERFASAVAALGRAGAERYRNVAIAVKGSGARQLGLEYVSAAPVWKPAFRLVLDKAGKARLQGWAVLENATGEDWNNVDLTLTSGAPVTLSQKLYDRYWRERPDLPVVAGAADRPRTDEAAAEDAAPRAYSMERAKMARPAPPPAPAAAMAPAPLAEPAGGFAPIAGAAEGPVAQENLVSVSFHLSHPVSLPRGQTLSMPFVDAEVPAERLAVYQPESGSRYPVSAVMLKNASGASLPTGILTVYDADTGFVGDAQLPALPVSEQRLASFAADRKVEISSEMKPEQRTVKISVSQGMLRSENLARRVTTYSIKGAPDAPRTVIIEHPRLAGWTTKSEQLDSTTPTHQRLRVQVAAGATAKVEVVDERPGAATYALADANAQALLAWSNAPADPALAAKLKQLAQARAKVAEAEQSLEEIDRKLAAQNDNQGRLRENLGAVPPDSELGRRYLQMMTDSENTIGTLAGRRDKISDGVDKLRKSYAEELAKL